MKASPAVAKSYAKALFELASERNQAEPIEVELQRTAALVAGDGELAAVFGRPWISPAARRKLADEIGQRLELSRLARDFFDLIASHGRADHLGATAGGVEHVAIGLRDGAEVVVEEIVDKNLLGGFVAEIGSLVVDGSLDGQLARIRERLAKG